MVRTSAPAGPAAYLGPVRVFITTLGSRGDVQPYVALGAGLQGAGHRVTVSTAARFSPTVEAQGLDAGPTTDGLLELLDSDVGRGAVESLSGLCTAARKLPALLRAAGPLQHQLIDDSWAAAQRARPDVVVYHPKAYWGPAMAHALGVPVVLAPLQPFFVPTGAWTAMGFPRLPLGRRYNRLTHRATAALTALGTERYLRPWRRAHGVPDRPPGATILDNPRGRPIPVVFGYSPLVVPPPDDWPRHVTVTGYWTLGASDWTPPPELAAFLDAGPPPVYVGFGSMAGRDPARTTRAVVDGLGRAGVRAVLATGWGGLNAPALPDSVLAIEGAPHDALFPRCAAVVHHGGAGTTAAGLRAGRPTVVCPFFGDQPFWGRRVQALGVGPAPVPQQQLTPERLAASVREAVTSDEIHQRAERLGRRLRAEDGVGAAVRAVEAAAGAA